MPNLVVTSQGGPQESLPRLLGRRGGSVTLAIGDLVCSDEFRGTGKVLALEPALGEAQIGFFEAPSRPETNLQWIPVGALRLAVLFQEAVVYVKNSSEIWRRGRYIEACSDGSHKVIFRKEEAADYFHVAALYVMNLREGSLLAPDDFLGHRSNDAPYFAPIRSGFVQAYLEQRAACHSLAALSSSSVALEPHQLAVVRRVLRDPVQKYLLADEVGLGKTIEAGILVRTHVLARKREARVLVGVPESLIPQWKAELDRRFHLGTLVGSKGDEGVLIQVCSHQELPEALAERASTMLVVDEAHQIAPWAWSEDPGHRQAFVKLSMAAEDAESVLLLSGTPLHGNERNYLAMLHLLSPGNHALDEDGVLRFQLLVKDRENLGGIVSALIPENANVALEGILDELALWADKDELLAGSVAILRPLIAWGCPEKGREREKAIQDLRRYLSEAYCLHRRMLRNRREDDALSQLFPGLGGLKVFRWPAPLRATTTEEWLEEYRVLAAQSGETILGMAPDQYEWWVDDLLANPSRVASRAKRLLDTHGTGMCSVEQEILESLASSALIEQEAKDRAFAQALAQWLDANPKGKAVVFCDDVEDADHAFRFLTSIPVLGTERHRPGKTPMLNGSEGAVRVLVCDRRGEDGLNLHGVQRLAVHYGLTRSISRIEQRLGRLNRYCPELRGVQRIYSFCFAPDRPGLTGHWLSLLDEGIGVFSSTVASLQYFIEDRLLAIWTQCAQTGDLCLEKGKRAFQGDDGWIAQERRRVRAQEELNALDEEMVDAVAFGEQLVDADELAEDQAAQMSRWITKGLQFSSRPDPSGGVRFFFDLTNHDNSRTLVDLRSFLESCLTGMAPDLGYPPRTEPMSHSRECATQGTGIYPLRFGQPFVDCLWDMIQSDSRGASWAFLRPVRQDNMHQPILYFRLDWLVSGCPSTASTIEKQQADETFPPVLQTQWIRDDGRFPSKKSVDFLSLPYKDPRSGTGEDRNLRPALWEQLRTELSPGAWEAAVRTVVETGRKRILGSLPVPEGLQGPLHTQLLSMGAVVVCHPDLIATLDTP